MKYIGCELVVGDNTDQGQNNLFCQRKVKHPVVAGLPTHNVESS
jgi:hypothetical protein